MSTDQNATLNAPVSLWRNYNYLLLWSGQAISEVGTQVSQIAFPLLILALTGSPTQAGFAGALRALPYFIFSLPAGVLIDRWDRKRVMICCDTGRALSLASIPFALALGHLTIVQLYLVAMIEGSLFVFFNIAETACLPRVVPRVQLPTATAQNQATDGAAAMLGPPLGGLLYSIGYAIPFLADAVSYMASVFSLLFIRTKFQKERSSVPRKLRTEMLGGVTWLWGQPLIRFIAVLNGGIYLITSGSPLIVIILAQHQHASSFTIGLIFAAIGIGNICGALLAIRIQRRFSFRQIIISTLLIAILLWPLYAIAPNPVVLGMITIANFTWGPIYSVVQFSYRLALIPDELQGRVNSVFRLIAFSGRPLGLALTGVLIQKINVIPTILLFFLGFVILGGATALNPYMRNVNPLVDVPAKVHKP